MSEVFIFGMYTLVCSFPGWVIAVPIILSISNLKTWRLYVVLALDKGGVQPRS